MMNLRTLFGGGALKPHWHFEASHVLWRFLVSENGLILGEDRDTDAKHVTFFAIEMHTGRVLWSGRSYGEAWWTGIEALVGAKLYLHGFAKPDMPEHHGLKAIDPQTGRELWSNNEISFYAADDERVIGFRDMFERRIFEAFDAHTGVRLGELQAIDADIHELRGRTFGRTDFIYPEPLGPTSMLQHAHLTQPGEGAASAEPESTQYATAETNMDENKAISALIERSLGSHPGAQNAAQPPIVEYARAEGRVAFSAHIPNAQAGSLLHLLIVVDEKSGKELFRDTLNADTPYPMTDSFFIDGDTLYYIKEKRSLVALPLI